jgi:beta-glucosidase-like glycosyl hydrolase
MRSIWASGVILFGGTVESVRRLTADLLRRAGRPLLIASDLERAGQQVTGLTEFPAGGARVAQRGGRGRGPRAVTAPEARAVGINWVFAPVADIDLLPENPIVQTRLFGSDPDRGGTRVRSWIQGCQGQGARLRQALPRTAAPRSIPTWSCPWWRPTRTLATTDCCRSRSQ